jgi:aspergillopepsin I
MREGQQAAYLASYPKGTSPIHNALNVVYLTNVTVGGQDFKLVLDTGSSDTWVVSDPFQCREGERRPVQESYCKLSKHYTKTATFRPTDLKMKTAYADGEMLEGEIGYDNVSIGGVAVNSAIGLVHDANWNGDGQSSGLLGMAFPTITRAFNGKQVQRYDPVFFSMHKQGLVPPVFSVALGRHNEEPGALSLGGLPDTSIVQFSKEFASAPMEYLRIRSKNGAPAEEQRTMYIATVQSFTINGVNVPVSTRLVVDTGTTFSYIPSVVVEAIKAAWSPPLRPVVNAPPGMFLAPCDSTPPKIKLNFNGRSVEINGQDLFVNQGPLGTRPEKGKLCTIGIGGGQGFVGEGLSMMGGTFMKSLVAVFDVGAAEMRFHQRVRKGGGRAAVEFDA